MCSGPFKKWSPIARRRAVYIQRPIKVLAADAELGSQIAGVGPTFYKPRFVHINLVFTTRCTGARGVAADTPIEANVAAAARWALAKLKTNGGPVERVLLSDDGTTLYRVIVEAISTTDIRPTTRPTGSVGFVHEQT